MLQPKYPTIEVQLTGEDGNAFAIIGRVSKAMRRAGLTKEQVDEYQEESTSGDYDNVLMTAMRYVTVN